MTQFWSKQPESSSAQGREPELGYILKGYPRISETFIANEIHLLETLGVKLSLFSVKRPADQKRHCVVDRVQAPVTYLPEVTGLSETHFLLWLWINLPKFLASHLQLIKRRPLAYLRTLLQVIGLSLKYRESFFAFPRKVFFKEFLQAGYIAARVLESERIGHLHAHFCHGATTIAMLASRLCGLPFSFTAHAKDIYLKELNPGDLLQVKMQKAKFVLTCTQANREHLERLRPAGAAPVYTVYHGVDTSLFRPSSNRQQPSLPLILSVGRFVEKKGFTYLVAACRLLKEKGYSFKCQIVGGVDKHYGAVKELIKQLQLEETVTLHTAVTQEELKRIYQQSTVFALPCLIVENGDRDGIPNALAEAMAMKLPVVATNISGIPELVKSGTNGLLVPPKDAAALASALEQLLNQPGLRQQLGEAARLTIRQFFDAAQNAKALKDLFSSCLNGAKGE